MARLSTIYDKIYDEDTGKTLSAKVFRLRGDEAYAKTTDIAISHNAESHDANGIHLSNFKINLYRTVGSSTVILYDGEDQLGTYTTTSSTSTVNVGTITLSYGDTHKLYAVYKGNSECLGSKSRTETIQIDLPSQYKTTIATTGTSTQINTNTNATLTAIVTVNGSETSATHNVDVEVNVDGDYYSTITTGSDTNVATGTVTDLEDGKYHITYEVANSNTIFYALAECDILVGCNVEIVEYPQTFINGQSNIVRVKVTNNDDPSLPMSGQTVSFNSTTATTNSSGIATITVTSITSGSYRATCNGNQSDSITVNVTSNLREIHLTPATSTVFPSDYWTYDGNTKPIYVSTVDATAQVPILISGDNISRKVTTNSSGVATYSYMGVGNGDVTITATSNNLSDTITLEDFHYIMYTGNEYGLNGIRVTTGDLMEYNNYWEITPSDGHIVFKPIHEFSSSELVFRTVPNQSQSIEDETINISHGEQYIPLNGFYSKVASTYKIKATPTRLKYYIDDVLQWESVDTGGGELEITIDTNNNVRLDLITYKETDDE